MKTRSILDSQKRILKLFILCSFLSSGCGNERHQLESNVINIEGNIKNFKPFKICDLNVDIRYVSLKGDSIFLKAAAESSFNKDYILVSDRSSCLLYRMDGQFITKIGRMGKGPGEYNVIRKLGFGPENNIYLNDGHFFSVYDLAGKFLYRFCPEANPDEIGHGCNVSSFAFINDSIFIGQISNDSGREKFKAVFFGKYGQTVKLVENFSIINKMRPSVSTANGDADIYRSRGQICFKERLNDTVFRIGDQYRFEPVYIINLGKFGMPKEVRGLPILELIKRSMEYIEVYQIFETSNYIFLTCAFNNHHPIKDPKNLPLQGSRPNWAGAILGVYEKGKHELFFANVNATGTFLTTSGLENDYDGGISFVPRNQVNEATLSMWVDVYLLKEHIASDYFKRSMPKYPEKKKNSKNL